MTSDPVGLVSQITSVSPNPALRPGQAAPPPGSGADFKTFLREQIDQVNQLQTDANRAMEDLAAGRRDDVESVIVATQKADIAFRMLLQVRNKVVDAYEEIKQIRI